MMTSRTINLLAVFLLGIAGLMVLTACGRSSPVAYYTLQPTATAGAAETLPADMAISVGPVMIPEALDRQLIVTRDAHDTLHLSEYHRWAAPLQKNIAEVLAQNLSHRLGSQRVTAYTAEDIFPPTHRIVVGINRFDGTLENHFVLDATWSVKKIGRQKPLAIRRTTISHPLQSADYRGLVAAQSKALASLSEKMAAVIMELAQKSGDN